MLEAREVSYRYRNHPWLLQHVNLQIHPGEVVGLYGKSGAGKTTLATILAGLKQPKQGFIQIDGHSYPMEGFHPVQLVWQLPEKVVNPKWRMKKILTEAGPLDSDLLAMLGINKTWLNRYPSELSGGELQRFCLARALGPKTKYLIADEMTTMLDAITQAQIWHTVLELVQQRNIGILAISHDSSLLERVCDRVINFDTLHSV
ncbi:ABC transporter ATP-binding protein [Virgibacillus halodenitrificans]|uniref:ABC transporter ATP-binding protein n=1 Tax=Virgibacillus halodenitrificans TaxID=1482 RepID=UPI000A3DC63D